jgi:hypothetical protein
MPIIPTEPYFGLVNYKPSLTLPSQEELYASRRDIEITKRTIFKNSIKRFDKIRI